MRETNMKLTDKRLDIQEIKREHEGLLAPTPQNIRPEDLKVMWYGMQCDRGLKALKASTTRLKAWDKLHGESCEDAIKTFELEMELAKNHFDREKKRMSKEIIKHPIAKRLCKIKGFTPYQLGIIMYYIKDVTRFKTPSSLCVYAGVSAYNGKAINKTNLATLRKEIYDKDPTREHQFGFSTDFKGRMYTVVECLLRARGFFFELYGQMKSRLIERAINNDETFIASVEDATGTKMVAGRHYMKGRNCQSVEMWAHSNSTWRCARILLHLIYTEWFMNLGLKPRNPYPIEYLGHHSLIKLDDIIAKEQ